MYKAMLFLPTGPNSQAPSESTKVANKTLEDVIFNIIMEAERRLLTSPTFIIEQENKKPWTFSLEVQGNGYQLKGENYPEGFASALQKALRDMDKELVSDRTESLEKSPSLDSDIVKEYNDLYQDIQKALVKDKWRHLTSTGEFAGEKEKAIAQLNKELTEIFSNVLKGKEKSMENIKARISPHLQKAIAESAQKQSPAKIGMFKVKTESRVAKKLDKVAQKHKIGPKK